MTKLQQFDGYNIDISRLASKIQAYLTEQHFEVASSQDVESSVSAFFIQARKRGIIRTTTGIRRSTNITIKGTSENFEVRIGTGEWGNNILVSAPLFVIPVVGIAATAVRVYSAKKFESNLWKHIKSQIELLKNTGKIEKPRTTSNQYNCDYVEGYPGWRGVVGGKMILEKKENGDRLIFEARDGEQITIPAGKIEKAAIILRKKGLGINDLLLEITCKDKNGDIISPVLNFSDDIIALAISGINCLVEKTDSNQNESRFMNSD